MRSEPAFEPISEGGNQWRQQQIETTQVCAAPSDSVPEERDARRYDVMAKRLLLGPEYLVLP